jgi:hypothetical protein
MDPDPGSGGPKNADPEDPDPQQYSEAMYLTIRGVGRQLRRIIEYPKHQLPYVTIQIVSLR